MTTRLNKVAYTVGISIAAFSGTVSTMGLANFAPGMEVPVYIMGALFEAGQLVAFAWLRRHWQTAPWLLRYGLVVAASAVVVLDIMGAAGMLSKDYEARQATAAATTERSIVVADAEVRQAEAVLADIDRQISALDEQIAKANDAKIKARDDFGRLKAARAVLSDAESRRPSLVQQRADAATKLIAAQTARGSIKGQAVMAVREFAAMQFFASTFKVNADDVVHGALYFIATLLVCFGPALVTAATSAAPAQQQVQSAPAEPVHETISKAIMPVALPEIIPPAAVKKDKRAKASEASKKGWETRRQREALQGGAIIEPIRRKHA